MLLPGRGTLERGTSVLAALVFVALLAIAGLALQSLKDSYIGNTRALAAAVGATERGTAASPQGIKEPCLPGYVNKVSEKSGNIVGPVDKPIQCWYKDPKTGNPVKVAGAPDDCNNLPSNQCRVEACIPGTVAADGKQHCETWGEFTPGNPASMAQYAKLQQSGNLADWVPVAYAQGNPDSLLGLKQNANLAENNALDNAFSQIKTAAQQQYDLNQATIDGNAALLEQLSRDCNDSTTAYLSGGVPMGSPGSACAQAEALKQQQQDLTAQNEALKQQLEALKTQQPEAPAPPEKDKKTLECTTNCGPGPGTQPPVAPGGTTLGAGSGLGSGLSSLLQGLARGLAQSGALAPQAAPQACTSDQNAYNQQLQQYQYQQQQYQYQLQLYNQQLYQQQVQSQYNNGSYYGITPTPPTLPSQPCYNPNAASQCTSQQPAQPAASQCTVGSWKPLYSGSCIVNWQCVPNTGTGVQPTAKLTCQPKPADVGSSLAISYLCTNASSSQGSGFDTGGAVSGTSTITVQKPPAGANTATYGLTCANGSLTASDQCSIQVAQPSIALVANPQTVKKGDTTSIGWVTSGMQACTISSPEQTDFTERNSNNQSVNGVASSSPITAQTDFLLDCTTLGGSDKSAKVTVTFPGAPVVNDGPTSTVDVTSTADGASVNHGDTVGITWQTDSAPSDTAIALWLIDERTGNTVGLVSGGQSASGTYTWQVPATGAACDTNSLAPCAADIIPGRTYVIQAALYTPSNAFLGGATRPQGAVAPTYLDYNFTDTFTIGG